MDETVMMGCQSKNLNTSASRLHYWTCGQGDPIVFLHGVPGCGQDWFSVMSVLSSLGQCLALDFPGSGRSIALDSDFSPSAYSTALADWIEALNLHRITWVLHGLGSAMGLDYILKHQSRSRAIVFYEPLYLPEVDQLSLPLEQQLFLASHLENINHHELEQWLYQMMAESSEKLKPEIIRERVKLYLQSTQFKEVIQSYFLNLKKGSDFLKQVHHQTLALQSLSLPKLLLYSVPGFMLDMSSIEWAKQSVSFLETMEVGEEWHFAHLVFAHRVGESISAWLQAIEQKRK